MQKNRFYKAPAIAIGAVLVFGATFVGSVVASDETELSQVIDPGNLEASILDSNRDPVAEPSADMQSASFDFDCQTTTGTLGEENERLYVTNPSAAGDGWSLTIAANDNTDEWVDGNNSYSFNDPSGDGCDEGQLTVDPSSGSITADNGESSEVNTGSSSAFDQGEVDDIELMVASSGDAEVWRGYIEGIGLSQKIPGETPAGGYSLDMTITATTQ